MPSARQCHLSGESRLPLRRLSHIVVVSLLMSVPLAHGKKVVMRDNFSGSVLNRNIWQVADWSIGRTQFGSVPQLKNGIARLTFDTYQFKGTEILTRKAFSREQGLEIAARVRLNRLPPGLVTSVFLYDYDKATGRSDELDVEVLTRQVGRRPGGATLLFTSWRQWSEKNDYQNGLTHWSMPTYVRRLNVNDWHVYVMRWLPDKTQWLVDGIRVAESRKAQPDRPSQLHINFWAPAKTWTEAHSEKLKPTQERKAGRRYFYDIDWVEIRQLR